MDLDTLITYVLLFLFFVLPSILKRIKKKKQVPQKKKKASLFGKLGDSLQGLIRELEKQALEAKKAQQAKEMEGREPAGQQKSRPGSIWEQLDDRADAGDGHVWSRKVEPALRPKTDQDLEWAAASAPPARDPEPRFYDPDHPFLKPREKGGHGGRRHARDSEGGTHRPPGEICGEKRNKGPFPICGNIPTHALGQAIVWSEILGKPVALRRD